jgi:hypothetical protein
MMNRNYKKLVTLAFAGIIGVSQLIPVNVMANDKVEKQITVSNKQNNFESAMHQLAEQGVVQGFSDGSMRSGQQITHAQLAKMIVLSLGLKADVAEGNRLEEKDSKKWYYSYVNTLLALGIIEKEDSKFHPNAPVAHADLAKMVSKALQRDVMSVNYWMKDFISQKSHATRGETAQLLLISQKSIRSETAQILEVKSLNKITLEIKFSAPLTLNDESIDVSAKNLTFDNGLSIVNQPRLKTGSLSTYIVPTTTQHPGTTYKLMYKGNQMATFIGSEEKIKMNESRQISYDTFEIESLKSEGVVDYGYIISAYSGGRGANAFILDENNIYSNQPFQIISSLRNRSVTITPEGGEPMVANYLGFTQSTDGKQEPKFRLPQGATFKPGVKYTVSSDWTTINQTTFVAGDIAPLKISSASQVDDSKLTVSLTNDPMDEMFAFRQVKLVGPDGTELTAQYELQSRKGNNGTFVLQNGGKLSSGTIYQVQPLGEWATAEDVTISAK